MITVHRLTAALALAAASATVAAAPVFFSTTADTFITGSGYGDDGNGLGGDLLGVTFSTIAGAHTATLSAGQSFTFNFGTITLSESQIGLGERDNLDVSARFLFTDPLAGARSVTATGTAVFGPVNGANDPDADYTIDWNDLVVGFGTGGSFVISLADLTFSATGSQTQTATITLRSEPAGAATTVPEPSSIALVGLALLGVARATRRR